MKVLYAACDSSKVDVHFAEKLMRVLLPSGRYLGRLVKRQSGSTKRASEGKEFKEIHGLLEKLASGPVASVDVYRGDRRLGVRFSNRIKSPNSSYVSVSGADSWKDSSLKSTYIPVKESGALIDVLLQLQRAGVQVFLATHDYVILKEIDLRTRDEDVVAFHSLYFDEAGEIACRTTSNYLDIHPNAIADTFTDLYDREIERDL